MFTDDSKNGSRLESEDRVTLDAYSEGHRQGYDDGLKQAQREVNDRLALLDNCLDALSAPFNIQNLQLSNYIAEISGKMAECLVRRELTIDPELIMTFVKEAVSAINSNTQEVNVHLHPLCARLIREKINNDSQEKNWTIIDDPLVGINDCKVSNENSLVDAALDTRVSLIISQILDDALNEKTK